MVCESCKSNIPETAKFCPGCGAKIERRDPEQAADKQESAVKAAPVAAASVAGAAVSSSEPDAAAGSGAPVASGPTPDEPVTAVAAGTVKDEKKGGADKPKSGSPALLIIILLVLFIAAAASGYFYYNKFIKKEPPKTENQAAPGIPGQAQAPGIPTGQSQPGGSTESSAGQPQPPASQAGGNPPVPSTQPQLPYTQPGSPAGSSVQQPSMPPPSQDQYQPPPQMRTRVAIKASALAADFRNGRPEGFSSSFMVGASRVVHYVQYDKASVGQTTFSSQFYHNGAMIFKCGPSPLQYKSGKYFCRPAQNLDPGNYEVKFIVDGNEEQILKFSVSY